MFTDGKIGTWSTSREPEVADRAKAEIYRVMARKYRFDPDDTRALGCGTRARTSA
jgi:hypothetical protein